MAPRALDGMHLTPTTSVSPQIRPLHVRPPSMSNTISPLSTTMTTIAHAQPQPWKQPPFSILANLAYPTSRLVRITAIHDFCTPQECVVHPGIRYRPPSQHGRDYGRQDSDTLGIRLPVDFAIFYQIAQSTSGTESYSEGFTLIASILHKIVSSTVSERT